MNELTSFNASKDIGTTNTISPPIGKKQIQEVSLSYSPPYTASNKPPKRDFHTALPFHFYNSDNCTVDDLETIPYFSAQFAKLDGSIPVHTQTLKRSLFDSPVLSHNNHAVDNITISECATFEELTVCSTFEQEKTVPLQKLNGLTSFSNNEESAKKSRIVVIDKCDKNFYSTANQSNAVYFPSVILTTTIVDIEPAKFERRNEKFKVEEQYIVAKYNDKIQNHQITCHETINSKDNQQKQHAAQHESYERNIPWETKYDDGRLRTNYNDGKNKCGVERPVDTSPMDEVKNVIERWENRIEEKTYPRVQNAAPHLYSVSRVDMNDNKLGSAQEKILLHQITHTRSDGGITWLSPRPPTISTLRTTENEKTVQIDKKREAIVPKPSSDQDRLNSKNSKNAPASSPLKQIPVSNSEIEISSAIVDISEKSKSAGMLTVHHSVTKQVMVADDDSIVKTEKSPALKDNVGKIEKKENVAEVTVQENTEVRRVEKLKTEDIVDFEVENDNLLAFSGKNKFIDENEARPLMETTDMSCFSGRASKLILSNSDWLRTTDKYSEQDVLEKGITRALLEGRGLASGAFTSGFGGGLVSGISSAGAICTTQIRDAREREKREIGLLNDRLADYIEKVRFLEAQNQCLSHDINILRRGFSGDGHVSGLFDREISQAQRILEQTVSGRALFDKDIAVLSADIETMRTKWMSAVNVVKAHREDHNVDLDRLAKIEAEISLFKRKIRIVEEDVIRIRKENDEIYNEIARIKQLTHNEVALKNERCSNAQELLQRIKLLQIENNTRIEQELVFIRRDTTAENRDYFRHELQAAIRDIRADYDAISIRNRNDIEVWYREQIRKIQTESTRVNPELYKEELASIRSTVTSVKSRLAEVEGRNFFLEKLIEDLRNNEESKLYEISLAEKDAQITKLREQCTELSIQMERLCDNEISLRAEIERYRILLNEANVTTYVSNTHPAISTIRGSAGTTRVITETNRTHSSSNISYSGVPVARSGYTLGGNAAGISIGDTVGVQNALPDVRRGAAGSVLRDHGSITPIITEKRLDRVHDEKGVDAAGRSYHSWYLGTIAISQVTPNYIELKNICKIRRVDVGGFRIKHYVNNHLRGTAQIDVPLILDPQEVVRFNHRHGKYLGQFFMEIDAFDNSVNARTSMYNYTEPTEERAWFIYID